MNTRYSISDMALLLLVIFAGMWLYNTFVPPAGGASPDTATPRPEVMSPTPTYLPGHQPALTRPPVATVDTTSTITPVDPPAVILVAPATYTPSAIISTTSACNEPPMNTGDMICKYNMADVQACSTAIQNNAWLSDICQQMKAEFIYMAGANNGNK